MRTQARASAVESTFLPGRQSRPVLLWAAAFAIACAALFVTASSALGAVDTYFKVGEFAESKNSSADGKFSLPIKAAVDDATGNVLVVDSGNNRVEVFSPSGDSGTFLTKFGEGTLSEPFGIAIDQSDGDVYVSDAGNHRIVRFTSSGAPTPTYTLDPTFTSPGFDAEPTAEPGEIGNFAAPIAVDSTSGDLVVGDPGHKVIDRYESDGTFVSAFDGSTAPSGTPFGSVSDIALTSSGDVIVAQARTVSQFGTDGSHEFDLGGELPPTFAHGTVVGFDPNTGYTLVGYGYGAASSPLEKPTIRAYRGETLVSAVRVGLLKDSQAIGTWSITGIAVDGGGSAGAGHVYAVGSVTLTCCGVNVVNVLAAGTAPGLTLDPPTSPGQTSVHLSGTVNPNGADTRWRFELSPDGANWFSVPSIAVDAGDGTAPIAVSADPTNLQPNTEYQARLTAESKVGARTTPTENPPTFTTLEGPPRVEALGPAPLGDVDARLNARINPNGLPTTYRFEYGTDGSYGSVAPATEQSAGEGTNPVLVSAEIAGLAPGTTYHYRVVATNGAGSAPGEDVAFSTFTTAAAAHPQRGIELVNQPEKGQQVPSGSFLAPDSERALWGVFGGAPGATSGAGALFLADRTPTGWVSKNLLPEATKQAGEGYNHYEVVNYTPDLTHFVFSTAAGILTFSDTQILTLDDQGNQRVLWSFPPRLGTTEFDSTNDLTHVVGWVEEPIDPRHVESTKNVYDFGSGTPELVDLMPDGSVPACGASNFGSGAYTSALWISTTDASQVFFESAGSGACDAPSGLYVRHRDDGTTTWISGPPISGDDRGAEFLRADASGEEAIFASSTRLDPNDGNDTQDLYRYRRDRPVECLTCIVSNAEVNVTAFKPRPVAVSADLSHAYFVSSNVLVPGQAEQGALNLYVWHDGQIDYVGPASSHTFDNGTYLLSNDGNVFFFLDEVDGMTTDDNGGQWQYYRYDARARTTECVSCRPDGGASENQVEPGSTSHGTSEMSADGDTFMFETPEALLPEDVNQTDDAYEWHNGSIALVTNGETVWPEGPGALSLSGISANGVNALFKVGAQLTGYEADSDAQLYDARIGGGFGTPPKPPVPCESDACQGPLEAPPPASSAASAGYSGPGNAESAAAKKKPKKCGKPKAKRGERCVAKHKPKNKNKHAEKRAAKHGKGGGK